MAAIGDLSWLFQIIGYTLAALGLLLLARALFWDRARGRRRCPRCWYDMAGVPGLTCPECGRSATRESKLARTRRRWFRAALGAIVILLGAAAARVPDFTRNGWLGAIPSTVLVFWPHAAEFPAWGFPVMPPPPPTISGNRAILPVLPFVTAKPDTVQQELHRRYINRELWHWQQALVTRAQPDFTPDQWASRIWTPRRSPTGAGVRLHLKPEAISGDWPRTMIATGLFKGGKRAEATPELRGGQVMISAYDIGTPPDAPGPIPVRLEFYEHGRGDNGTQCSVHLWTMDVQLPVEVRGPIEDILTPIDFPEAQRAIQAMRITYVPGSNKFLYFALAGSAPLEGVTLGLSFDLFRNDAFIERLETVAAAPYDTGNALWWLPTDKAAPLLQTWDTDGSRWHVRIKGDGVIALRMPRARNFWRGEATLPIKRLDQP